MNRKYTPYWLLTATYATAFMLPGLLSEGTFLDGQIYAVLARNLAAGLGSFWAPHFSSTVHVEFYQHPPMAYGLESIFFRVLGDHVYVEHVYSLFTALVTAWLIVALWKWCCGRDAELRPLGWLPVLLWLMNPQITWAYTNNILETTMGIFTLGAVLVLLQSFAAARLGVFHILAAALMIVAGALTKGPVAFFPLAVPIIYTVTTRRISWRRALGSTTLLTALIVAIFGLLWLWPAARGGMQGYLDDQLLLSMGGGRGDVDNRFGFLVKLFETLLPALALTLLIVLWGRFKGLADRIRAGLDSNALFFLVLALAASLPLVVSPCQSLFYLVPSFPLYSLAMATVAAPAVAGLTAGVRADSRGRRIFGWISLALLLGAVGWSLTFIGTYNRDETLMRDVKLIGAYITEQNQAVDAADAVIVFSACENLRRNWALETNLVRYFGIAMQREGPAGLYLIVSGPCSELDGGDYRRVPLETQQYHLYQLP